MRFARSFVAAIPVLAVALSHAGDAAACGGCFHEQAIQQAENTQVTGHKMILSVSKTQTTLWDQISYMGAPSSFAWVLPIKGVVDVGLSSDALFQNLEVATQVSISSPVILCDPPPVCGDEGFLGGISGSDEDPVTPSPPPVVVTAHAVVGPYDTVQLHSTDPAALTTWLAEHNYVIPADVQLVIDAYVGEGFDFLALKLVPGLAVTAMRPVRVTTPGGSPVLPLRMVAAGTGATTSVSLWILGEGRYEPTNMPGFTIDAAQLTWDWDTMSSDYAVLKQATFDASKGKAWLVEAAEPFSSYYLQDALTQLASYDPVGSGYADAMGKNAPKAALADVTALFGTLAASSVWVTRLHGELSRAALAHDLTLGASPQQASVSRALRVTKTKGTAPTCPLYSPCDDFTSGGGGGATSGGDPSDGGNAGAFPTPSKTRSCAMSGGATSDGADASSMIGALGVAAALAFARRRRAQ